jgi:ATP-dependent Clp protease adaptor protein ClpS
MRATTEVEEKIQTEEVVETLPRLVVYNDSFNTFDHVILSFQEVLGYDEIRAEQLAWNIHNTGRAIVKEDVYETLVPFDTALKDRELDSRIE